MYDIYVASFQFVPQYEIYGWGKYKTTGVLICIKTKPTLVQGCKTKYVLYIQVF